MPPLSAPSLLEIKIKILVDYFGKKLKWAMGLHLLLLNKKPKAKDLSHFLWLKT